MRSVSRCSNCGPLDREGGPEETGDAPELTRAPGEPTIGTREPEMLTPSEGEFARGEGAIADPLLLLLLLLAARDLPPAGTVLCCLALSSAALCSSPAAGFRARWLLIEVTSD